MANKYPTTDQDHSMETIDNIYYDANDYILTVIGEDDLRRIKTYLFNRTKQIEYALFTPITGVYEKDDQKTHGYILLKEQYKDIHLHREIRIIMTHKDSKIERAVIRYDVDTKRQWQSKILNTINIYCKKDPWIKIGNYPFDLINIPSDACNHLLRNESCLRCELITDFDLFFYNDKKPPNFIVDCTRNSLGKFRKSARDSWAANSKRTILINKKTKS